jgi:hypothetical protein
VELDDGDDRAMHINQIRYLPPGYPIVTCNNDPLAVISRRRRRESFEIQKSSEEAPCYGSPRGSIEDVAMEERIAVAKRARYDTSADKQSPTKSSPSKQLSEEEEGNHLKFKNLQKKHHVMAVHVVQLRTLQWKKELQ